MTQTELDTKLKAFIEKWIGQRADFDGWYGSQCVDLYDFYCRDVISSPVIFIEGAADIWSNYPTDHFDRIFNTPEGVPQPGDIIIWSRSYGAFGHVAIVTEANVNTFKALSQNDPIGRETHIREYNYAHVLGWLRPKLTVNPEPVSSELQNKLDTYFNQLVSPTFVINFLEERRREIDILNARITEKDGLIASQTQTIAEISREREELLTKNQELQEDNLKKDALREKWLRLYETKKSEAEVAAKGLANCSKELTRCRKNKELALGDHLLAAWFMIWNRIKGIK